MTDSDKRLIDSLAALQSIIHARVAGKNVDHIYRKSKLTMALKVQRTACMHAADLETSSTLHWP